MSMLFKTCINEYVLHVHVHMYMYSKDTSIHVHVHVQNVVCVCAGLAVGGVWGIGEGVQRGVGLSNRLKATAIVNGITRRGPFLGNNLAILGECTLYMCIYAHSECDLLECDVFIFMYACRCT